MKNILKIIAGALVIAFVADLLYFGVYELMLQVRISDMNKIGIVILVAFLSCIIPALFLLVNIMAYLLCKKNQYVNSYQCKIMLLLSTIVYVVFGYGTANIYCKGLAFDEGLGFVIELIISLIVAVMWILILIALIICEYIAKKMA